jgi:hypothetical protein
VFAFSIAATFANPIAPMPPHQFARDRYITERIDGQLKYFRDHAIVAALLGAASTIIGRQAYGAWVAVITTIIGAVASHALVQRYEQLASSYRATADRLQGIVARYRASNGTLDELVQQAEAALFEQNQGWIAGGDEMIKDSGDQRPFSKGHVVQANPSSSGALP